MFDNSLPSHACFRIRFNPTVQLKALILKLTKTAGKSIGMTLPSSLQFIFQETVIRQARKVISDPIRRVPANASDEALYGA